MKKDVIAKIFIITFICFNLLLLDNSPEIILTDASTYILLGKSILLRQGYRQIWSVDNEKYTATAVMLPLLLTPIIYFFGYNFLMMKLLCILMAAGALWIIYRLFRIISDEWTALLILIFTGASYQFIYYCHRVLTEIPYLLFSLMAITFIGHYKYSEDIKFNKTLIAAVFFTLVAYFTRPIGISLAAAILVYFLFERKPNQIFPLFLKNIIILGFFIFIPIILWESRNYNSSGWGGIARVKLVIEGINPLNVTQRFTLFETALHSIYAYVFYAYPKILLGIQFAKRTVIALIVTTITFYGFLYCLAKRRRVIEYYVIFFMLLLFFWPWSVSAGARFIVPIIPFIFYYFIIGMREISRFVKGKEDLKKGLLIFLIALLLFVNIKETVLLATNKEDLHGYSQKQLEGFLGMVKWVKENTQENAIFASSADSPIYLYFGRRTIEIPLLTETGQLMNIINTTNVNYAIIISTVPYTKYFLQPLINRNLDRFIEVYRKNDNAIYQVKR